MTGFIQKAMSVLRQEEKDGRIEFVFQDADRKKYPIRLYQGEGVTHLPDPEWLLRNFIQKGGLTIVYGPPGSGKSLMMLDWAQHLQMDRYWLGRNETRKANALYVMAEGQFGLKQRLEAWQVEHDVDELPPVRYHIEGVTFWSPEGKENPGAEAIVAAAAALEVDVVFIDTMAATFGGGDENRQQDMNLYLKPLRELRNMGISVVIAHHANRGEGAIRGSSVLGGDADTIIEMRPTVDQDNPGRVQWTTVVCRKQKDYVPFPPFRLNLKSVPLDDSPTGYERSGPVFVQPEDSYQGPQNVDGKRINSSQRRDAMRRDMSSLVGKKPGISWRRMRDTLQGKNAELAVVRDELVEMKVLEYDEAEGGYVLGEVNYDDHEMAEIPPEL